MTGNTREKGRAGKVGSSVKNKVNSCFTRKKMGSKMDGKVNEQKAKKKRECWEGGLGTMRGKEMNKRELPTHPKNKRLKGADGGNIKSPKERWWVKMEGDKKKQERTRKGGDQMGGYDECGRPQVNCFPKPPPGVGGKKKT